MSTKKDLGYGFERLTVLVVEDNNFTRLLLRSVLTALGIVKVVEASDGAEGLVALRERKPDVILTDWMMTPIDGIEFIRHVRHGEDSPNPFIPIVMLTGHTELARVMEARDAGVNEFLAKPISPKSILSRLVALVEHPRPFIKTPNYFGPDRRRRQVDFAGAERRGGDDGDRMLETTGTEAMVSRMQSDDRRSGAREISYMAGGVGV
jgi:CheY-like chemotaxis protein